MDRVLARQYIQYADPNTVKGGAVPGCLGEEGFIAAILSVDPLVRQPVISVFDSLPRFFVHLGSLCPTSND